MENKELSKKELVRALKKIEKNPRDSVGLAAEASLIGLTSAGSAAAASTLLTSVVTTTSSVIAPVFGSTMIGGLVGAEVITTATAIVAAPILPIAVAAIGGIAISCGLIKLSKDGWTQNTRRKKQIKELKNKISSYNKINSVNNDSKSKYEKITKLAGIYALLLKLDSIAIKEVQTIFQGISNGSINTTFALNNAESMLNNMENNKSLTIE